MNNKVNDFPQYRMMNGRKVYYKILSDKEFIELSWIGDKPFVHHVKAQQYPEMLRIMDMLNCENPFVILPVELEKHFLF
ncbi:MAG: hypothetical protein M9916_10045 [Crocinitomicaceae bacterium]|nr:hypothetical protein [Crocinitomicaceae bacterium]